MKKVILIVLFFISINLINAQQNIKKIIWKNMDSIITEAHIDECVTIYAETENINNSEKVNISIWMKGEINDILIGEYISRVINNEVNFYWFVTEEIYTNSLAQEIKIKDGFVIPQLFFTVQYGKWRSYESDLLQIYNWLNKLVWNDSANEKQINLDYRLYLADGTERNGWTDANGYLRELYIPFGDIFIDIDLFDNDIHEVEPAAEIEDFILFYQVRPGDSLWKIAGYDFVYGNPHMWIIIYEANKHNFTDEKSPDLIEIDQALIIPVINDEIRTGIFWKIKELIKGETYE